MKTQQKKFVVELKFARRRRGVKKTSIWGDADLKALAREAAAEAEELFAPIRTFAREALEASQATLAMAAPAVATDRDGQLEDPPEVAAFEREQDTPAASTNPSPSEPSVSKVVSSPHIERIRQKPKPRSRSADAPTAQPRMIDSLEAELVKLSNENRRLKLAFKERLMAQNAQLREMLTRYQVR